VNKTAVQAQIAALQAQLMEDETGVYQDTRGRWYVKFRVAGKQTTRRTFPDNSKLLTRDDALQAKGQWEALLDRNEVTIGRVPPFEVYWQKYLRHARAEMTHGAWVDQRAHGTKRLLPHFTGTSMSAFDIELIRDWRALMYESVEAGEWAAKTINNARGALLGCCRMAVEDRHLTHNPVLAVKPLKIDYSERPYLRLGEIDCYLDGCSPFYRPLGHFLIGSGARISEAIALRIDDVDFHTGTVKVHRQRARGESLDTVPTKGRAFRSVSIGPLLVEALKDMLAMRAELGLESDYLFLAPPPRKGRYAGRVAPPHRRTVHIWHQQAVKDSGVPVMPLHSLRHTAAAAWLSTPGVNLEFVKAQLGHSSVKVTSDYYSHLEENYRAEGAADTEARIRNARQVAVVLS
jgi:integrase